MLAADNARLCDRLLTAEAVVEAARAVLRIYSRPGHQTSRDLQAALDKHDAGKPC